MKKTLALIVLLSVASPLLSQSSKIKQRSQSTWVTDITFNKEASPEDGQEASFYYLLIDEQENTIQQESYFHYAYKILTSDGVQEMSNINVDFDPSYTEIAFHAIAIHRDGKVIDQLPKEIRTIQREQSMDRFLYDGSLTAVINLSDIRIGDIIEYTFTRKGYNPVYKGHIAKKIYFNYTIGYEKSFQKLIVPTALELQLKSVNTDLKPVITKSNGQTSYAWSSGKTAAVIMDNFAPDWFTPFNHVMITDFKNWYEVAAWALKLFEVSEADKEAIKKSTNERFKDLNDSDYVLQVIQFVQDEIRYLGFESGLNSHKPFSPKKVYEQRFGDCKDKSLLLCTILGARGIEASPMLVSTVWRHKILEQMPGYDAFNHCVVQIRLNHDTIYVDPTTSNQGGNLRHRYFPSYGKGLVVNDKTPGIVSIPKIESSNISEIQTFDLVSIGGEATLSIKTVYTGVEADIQRTEFSKKSIETIQKNYLTFYGNLYPDITKFETLSTHDNREDNVFSVEEKYKISTFWRSVKGEEGKIYCEFYPQSLENYFNISKSAQRQAPYQLAYPLDYHHAIHIKLPDEWPISPNEEIIESKYYLYDYKVSYEDNEISLLTDYKIKESHVPVEDFGKLVEDHEKMLTNLSYMLTYNKNIAEAGANKVPGIIVTLVSIGIGIFLIYQLYNKYDPVPHFTSMVGEPIGGWLILVAIGLTLSPLKILYDIIVNSALISGEAWLPFFYSEQYGIFTFLLLEHIYNLVYLFFSLMVVVLFYQRRSSVPVLVMFFYGVACLASIADTVGSLQIDANSDAEKNFYLPLIRSILAAAIWIPYFILSSRVKETFVYTLHDPEQTSVPGAGGIRPLN